MEPTESTPARQLPATIPQAPTSNRLKRRIQPDTDNDIPRKVLFRKQTDSSYTHKLGDDEKGRGDKYISTSKIDGMDLINFCFFDKNGWPKSRSQAHHVLD